MAVPGPVRSSASAGSNALLSYPQTMCCTGAADVLGVLGIERAARPSTAEAVPQPESTDASVLEAVDWAATSLEQLMGRTGLAWVPWWRASIASRRRACWPGAAVGWSGSVAHRGRGAPGSPAGEGVHHYGEVMVAPDQGWQLDRFAASLTSVARPRSAPIAAIWTASSPGLTAPA